MNKRRIKGAMSNPDSLGKMAVKTVCVFICVFDNFGDIDDGNYGPGNSDSQNDNEWSLNIFSNSHHR